MKTMSMKDKNQGDLKNDTCNTSMIQMIPMIKSFKWRTHPSHLYCWCFVRGDDDVGDIHREEEEEEGDDVEGKDDEDEDDDDSDDLGDQELQVAHTSKSSVLLMFWWWWWLYW